MEAATKFKDSLDREIELGDVITYPSRQGSGMWVNFGRVVEIKEDYLVLKSACKWVTKLHKNEKVSRLYRVERATILNKGIPANLGVLLYD